MVPGSSASYWGERHGTELTCGKGKMAFVLFSSTHLSVFISSLGEKDVNLVENNKLTCRLILFYLL